MVEDGQTDHHQASQPQSSHGDTILLQASPSSNLYLLVLGAAAVVILAMFSAFILRQNLTSGRAISLAVFLVVLGGVLAVRLYTQRSSYVITDERVVAATGFLEATPRSLERGEVDRVEALAPWWMRWAGLGTIRFHPEPGGEGPVAFAFVEEPRGLKAKIDMIQAQQTGPNGDRDTGGQPRAEAHSSNG